MCLPCMLILALSVIAWAGCSLSSAGKSYLQEIDARVALPTIRARIFCTVTGERNTIVKKEGANRGGTDAEVRVYIVE